MHIWKEKKLKFGNKMNFYTHEAQQILLDDSLFDLPYFTGCQAGNGVCCIKANSDRVCVHTDSISDLVYSDSKWLGFIINQIIFNSIKYCSDKPPVIQIKSKDMGDYVTLSITDNGIGIKPSEVNRVFDKGFVGSNGRMRKKSTGIGLYLCDQLCLKLGIGIDIESEVGCYTTVLLHFPKSNHLNV